MEDLGVILLVSFGLMLLLLALGIYVGVIMAVLAVIAAHFFSGHADYLEAGIVVWPMMRSFVMVALPLFILMGEILVRSGVTNRLYWALDQWFHVLPGGLLHTNIASCAVFASVSGSSVATGATIGTVALPAFRQQRYNERLVLGSLAAGGTLGILIPPSMALIMYGLLTDTSIGQLFIGGIVPGICLAGLFMAFIGGAAIARPEIAGRARATVPLRERVFALVYILPVLFVVFFVLGSLYLGVATPSESAALGVVAALIVAAGHRRLNRVMLYQALMSTARTLAMVMLILMGTLIFNFVITLLGVPRALASLVAAAPLSPLGILLLIALFYLFLGMFMESLPMIITTIPVIFPVVISLGYDPVWFGVLLVLLMEAALITPPVGLNLFVIQGVRLTQGPMSDVMLGSLPFLAMMLVMMGLIIAFPELVLWLPAQMMQ